MLISNSPATAPQANKSPTTQRYSVSISVSTCESSSFQRSHTNPPSFIQVLPSEQNSLTASRRMRHFIRRFLLSGILNEAHHCTDRIELFLDPHGTGSCFEPRVTFAQLLSTVAPRNSGDIRRDDVYCTEGNNLWSWALSSAFP